MASKSTGPDLKKYMDKRLNIKLNADRKITGILRGYDQFMNLVLADTEEQTNPDEVNALGMVVIRGNSVVQIECLDHI